jgi:hypothetical protein
MKIKTVKLAIVAVVLVAVVEPLTPQINARQADKSMRSVWDGVYTT